MKIKELGNKSKVLITNRYYLLISYETIVLIYDKLNEIFYKLDKFKKTVFNYETGQNEEKTVLKSNTTTKHINEFLNYYNLKFNYEDKTKIKVVDAEFINNIDLLEIK